MGTCECSSSEGFEVIVWNAARHHEKLSLLHNTPEMMSWGAMTQVHKNPQDPGAVTIIRKVKR
jgi:hypothetical protein